METVKRHVDLCSGIGGFALGFEWAQLSTPVLFCDSEEWCRKVLKKHWTDVPILNDVKELANDPTQIPDCDILTAGYPCQPFSLASPKRKGTEDPRHLWPYLLKIVTSKRPTWCVFENVYGHVSMGLDTVLNDLETQGYSARTFNVPALSVDANHKRERLWIVANARDISGRDGEQRGIGENGSRELDKGLGATETVKTSRPSEAPGTMADSESTRTGKNNKGLWSGTSGVSRGEETSGAKESMANSNNSRDRTPEHEHIINGKKTDSGRKRQPLNRVGGLGKNGRWEWQPEPSVGRVAHGVPRRMDRIRGLGNAIVPQIAMQIGMAIKEVY